MNEIINENELTVVKEYEFDNPLIQNIICIINKCYRDCHNKYYHTFNYECVYDLNFTNDNNEIINFTISGKNIGLYELNKKLTLARERGFKFKQINNFQKKILSKFAHINIHYHLKLSASPMHRQFLKYYPVIEIIFKLIAMTVEILFILHVVNGIYIIIQVYLHEFIYKY